MEFNNELTELVYFFDHDNELLELVNSLSSLTVKDLHHQEQFCDPPETTFLDTSNIKEMDHIFLNQDEFNNILLWNTKNVTTMEGLFEGATSFNQPLYWNTENVKTMMSLFEGATSFNQPLYWNTENVVDMMSMFQRATLFNQSLDFNTKNVKYMISMFSGAVSFNQRFTFDVTSDKLVEDFDWDMYVYAISCERENIHDGYFQDNHCYYEDTDYEYDSDSDDEDWDLEECRSTKRHIRELR